MALTKEQLKELKEGQELYLQSRYGRVGQSMITKIGNKYFYCGRRQFSKETGKYISDGQMEVEAYINEQAYIDQCKWREARIELMHTTRDFFVPADMTIEQITELTAALKDIMGVK